MVGLNLKQNDASMLAGEQGEAKRFAMSILSKTARAMGANRLVDIVHAHIDGCLYHGQSGLDFVNHALAANGQVAVKTTLNVGSLDLLHPELFQGSQQLATGGRALMEAYVKLGCEATFTCAPYQLATRPAFGEHVVWAESNAIVFANSVLGARTNRYGDFIDLCAALTGRAPYSGLHTDAGRRGQHVFRLTGFSDKLLGQETFFAALGLYVGKHTGARVPVVVGLPEDTTEDALKSLGAAAATTGSVGLFHAVGVTPEAPTLANALQHQPPEQVTRVTPADLKQVLGALQSPGTGKLSAVCLGTPHFSLAEFEQLVSVLKAYEGRAEVEIYVNTGRYVLEQLESLGYTRTLEQAGVTIVVDTCTYITPILKNLDGVVMTNSGKWAYYAPNNLGVAVAFGCLEDCIKSAYAGEVTRDDASWL